MRHLLLSEFVKLQLTYHCTNESSSNNGERPITFNGNAWNLCDTGVNHQLEPCEGVDFKSGQSQGHPKEKKPATLPQSLCHVQVKAATDVHEGR